MLYFDTKKVGDLVSANGFLGIIVEIVDEPGDRLIAQIEWIGDRNALEHYVHEYEYCHNLKLESG
jgi:hypothetical protein